MIPPFLRTFVLLGSFIGVVHCVQVTVPKSVVNVTVGQSATLPCTYTLANPNIRNLVIQWDFVEAHSQKTVSHSPCYSLKNSSVNQCLKLAYGRDARGRCSMRYQVYAYQNGQSYSMGRFQNRVTFSNTTGNATITISNMQPQDTGVYRCEVSNFPDPLGEGQIQLIVQVAPSAPHCSIQGNIVTGHSVKLVCYSEQGMPRPDYIWQRVTNGIVKPINMGQQNGVLTIGNMSKLEDGYYHCTASNSLGNTTCQLDLHTGGAAGAIVGGIIGAVLLATIICVVIWFLVVKNKHKKKHLKSSELKTVSATTGQSAAEEPARQNLVVSEPPETREYQDVPENVAAGHGEVEDPAV
ncbi:V-set and immunoglobulin domain-containing protein 1 isoform X2 [Bufo bufo]|uniref:V-set and immunoglobulin domain-containing protein 1 isoform X2 n=1 Tax=Bufo bufo TaxID=8384 RepID=UPI001ABE354D|nr:V-set and immunoglobulin domain-containing protein 1 isoform X2 [Bufo bufo]